jgi:ABC-type iron transport system FetAB permease component
MAIGRGAEALGLSAEEALAQLGDEAVDVYLNEVAFWRGVGMSSIAGHLTGLLTTGRSYLAAAP